MDQIYSQKMNQLGYNQLVCDIFLNWEDVKDEILLPERKEGSGNGTIHVFLGAADAVLQQEFADYYKNVKDGEDPAIGAIKVKHYFMPSNAISMLGYVCQYNYNKHQLDASDISHLLESLQSAPKEKDMLTTYSYLKLSTGSSRLRPYFKQFESNGVFHNVIRQLLLPQSAYKISLFKNQNGDYAAFWLIGFDSFTDFEADNNSKKLGEKTLATADNSQNHAHQQIFYGAPGTGKSHRIKEYLESKKVPKENIFRTTFHPDSDYSSFVGAYKPTMKKQYRYDGKVKAKYYEDDDLAGAKRNEDIIDKVIQYDFVPQTFVKAYVRAYQTDENVYLVIEEINRGNCAQIFGDLFQLLDRNESGVSDYTIKADADLETYLKEALGKDSEGIKDGELCLPSNLYIFATMNTSDQSLFPIDSAFKRRWEWEYEPIKYKNNNWAIEIDNLRYSWISFQKTVNDRIFDATGSEDKMLGDYFVKAEKNVISENLLLNKILFYLWNDVCKDGEGDIFMTEDGKELKFSDLYGESGTTMLLSMMKHLNVDFVESADGYEGDDTDENTTPGQVFTKPHLKIVFPDGSVLEDNNSTNTVVNFINKVGPERVFDLQLKVSKYPFISKEILEDDGKGYAQSQRELTGGYYVTTKLSTESKMRIIQNISTLLKTDAQVSIVEI